MRALDLAECEEFLAQPHVGVLSVAADGGRPPLSVPVWHAYEPGGNLTFFTGTRGRKARKVQLLERAGTFSFCVQKTDMPNKFVTAECTVLSADRNPPIADVLAIAARYLPEDVAQAFAEAEVTRPSDTFVLVTARPTRWLSFDFSEQ